MLTAGSNMPRANTRRAGNHRCSVIPHIRRQSKTVNKDKLGVLPWYEYLILTYATDFANHIHNVYDILNCFTTNHCDLVAENE